MLERKLAQCPIIAIDGPSSSGKGTLAKELARILRFRYLDTGKLYRIFAVKFATKYSACLSHGDKIILSGDEMQQMLSLLPDDNSDYHTEHTGKVASLLAKNVEVRSALLKVQRKFVYSSLQGIVVDGRDISSVVCPNADVKVFITAYTSVRARRRFKQLQTSSKAHRMMYKNVFFHLLQRDIRDSRRSVAPLVCTKDSLYIDNSRMNPEKTLQELLKNIKTLL